ncbi:MAG TPA: cytidylate kinase family protein [Nitrososphaera sp.]|jgi:cytidylate kinase|nr:cytidylate kinase family protein [Nitrososphaera sp.]
MVANKLFSIVISGWPAVGKTTIACKLAEEFDIVMYNGGDILKMLAEEDRGYSVKRDDWWDTTEAKKFMEERKTDPSFDKKVDNKLIQIVTKGGTVITSYTLPWLVVDESVIIIKFWLRGSSENRAKRMANRDGISFAEAKRITKLRDEENKRIYYRLYGFRFGEDLTVFDYVLNTDTLSLDSLVEISKLIVRRHIGGQQY